MKNITSLLATIFILTMVLISTSCNPADLDEDGFDSTTSSINTNTAYSVNDITSFTWITGNASWKQASRNRLESSRFTFRSNGDFVYQFDFDSTLSYTLTGDYFEDANGYSFVADYSVFNGGGSQQILVSGTLRPTSSGEFKVNMEYGSSAYYGATVNEQEFFNQASKRFTTIMLIE